MALPPSSTKQRRVMMRTRKTTKVARGRFAKSLVLKGTRERTSGGLRRDDLMLNKRGKAVSKKASARGKQQFRNVEPWLDCMMQARKALHIVGFVAINGSTLQGKALYVKTKALCKARQDGAAALAASASAVATVASPVRRASLSSGCAQRLSLTPRGQQ